MGYLFRDKLLHQLFNHQKLKIKILKCNNLKSKVNHLYIKARSFPHSKNILVPGHKFSLLYSNNFHNSNSNSCSLKHLRLIFLRQNLLSSNNCLLNLNKSKSISNKRSKMTNNSSSISRSFKSRSKKSNSNSRHIYNFSFRKA